MSTKRDSQAYDTADMCEGHYAAEEVIRIKESFRAVESERDCYKGLARRLYSLAIRSGADNDPDWADEDGE